MKKLLLSSWRSLRKSKVAIIGLTLLVFFTSFAFTLMNDTSKNLTDTYKRVESEGKLHDMYIKEEYKQPSAKLEFEEQPDTASVLMPDSNYFVPNFDGFAFNDSIPSAFGTPFDLKTGTKSDFDSFWAKGLFGTKGFPIPRGIKIQDKSGKFIIDQYQDYDGAFFEMPKEEIAKLFNLKRWERDHTSAYDWTKLNAEEGQLPISINGLNTLFDDATAKEFGLYNDFDVAPYNRDCEGIVATSCPTSIDSKTENHYYFELKPKFHLKINAVGIVNSNPSKYSLTEFTEIAKGDDSNLWTWFAKYLSKTWFASTFKVVGGNLRFNNTNLDTITSADASNKTDYEWFLKASSSFIKSGGIKHSNIVYGFTSKIKPTDASYKNYFGPSAVVDKKYIHSITEKITSKNWYVTQNNSSIGQLSVVAGTTDTTKFQIISTKESTVTKIGSEIDKAQIVNKLTDLLTGKESGIKVNLVAEIKDHFISEDTRKIADEFRENTRNAFISKFSDRAIIRNHFAIDVKSSDQKFYKFIQSKPTDEVDKLLIDKRSPWMEKDSLPTGLTDLKKQFNDYATKILGDKFEGAELVQKSDGSWEISKNGNPYSTAEDKLEVTSVSSTGYGYVLRYLWTYAGNSVPQTISFVDPTSKLTIISPEFASENGKKPYTKNTIVYKGKTYTPETISSMPADDFRIWLAQLDDSYKINASGSEFLIIGTGFSPDFMYPVVSQERFTPTFSEEALAYLSVKGMSLAKESFSSSPTEEFLVSRTKDGVDAEALMEDMETQARSTTSLPSGIVMVRARNDTNEQMLLTSYRTMFAPKIVDTTKSVSLWLTIFMTLLTAFISIIIIYRYIMSRRETIGILKANGVKKWEIGVSLLPFALISSIIGGSIGYISGNLLQRPTINLIHDYWSIPTPITHFNWWSMMATFIVPFIGIAVVSFLVAIWNLRHKSTDLMKPGLGVKTNLVARTMKSAFNKLSVITRFRVSVAFNSIGRLLILSSVVSATVIALTFSIGATGKFKRSLLLTQANKKYSEKLVLNTPTYAGGEYKTQSYDELGSTDLSKDIKSQYFETASKSSTLPGTVASTTNAWDDTNSNRPTIQSPYIVPAEFSFTSMDDINYALAKGDVDIFDANHGLKSSKFTKFINDELNLSSNSLPINFEKDALTYSWPHRIDAQADDFYSLYMKNKVVVRELLDVFLGSGDIGQSPWLIVGERLPASQKAKTLESKVKFFQTIKNHVTKFIPGTTKLNPDYDPVVMLLASDALGEDYIPLPGYSFQLLPQTKVWKKFYDSTEDVTPDLVQELTGPNQPIQSTGVIKNSYPLLFRYISQKYKNEYTPYKISYGIIPKNKNDETFTHIDIDVLKEKSKPVVNDPKLTDITITGIDKNSSEMKLLVDNKPINDRLFNQSITHPIILSAYAAKHMGVKENDTITVQVNNHFKVDEKNQSEIFTVVGIYDSYQGFDMFTTHEIANQMVGLSNTGFNGIFSSNEGRKELMNSISLYSKTGLYPSVADVYENGSINSEFAFRLLGTLTMGLSNDGPTANGNALSWTQLSTSYAGLPAANNYLNFNTTNPNSNIRTYTQDLLKRISNSTSLPFDINKLSSFMNKIYAEGFNSKTVSEIMSILKKGLSDPTSVTTTSITADEKTAMGEFEKFIEDQIHVKYGSTIYSSVIKSVESKTFTSTAFENLSNVMTAVSASILGAIVIIAILILMVISHITISENTRTIATFKVLGFKNKQTINNLLSIYVPVILLGLAISVPVSIGLLQLFDYMVFSQAGILLDLQAQWWYFVISVLGVAAIIGSSLAISWNNIKKIGAVQALK